MRNHVNQTGGRLQSGLWVGLGIYENKDFLTILTKSASSKSTTDNAQTFQMFLISSGKPMKEMGIRQ